VNAEVPSRGSAEALASELVGEMMRRWRQGERPLAEEFLHRHPELRDHPEAAADLVYEELCLRQEFGPEVADEEILRRFPEWRPQLEVLFDCQRVLGPRRAAPRFPAAGEAFDDFLLLAELGGGSHGHVFLASQTSLGDRPVVVKLTTCDAGEHLALARLQHTNVVPLYSVRDHPELGIRALCMPYFGGATLDRLLEALRSVPPGRRTGHDLLDALDRSQAAAPLAAAERGPARQALAGGDYAPAVCRLGACLAEALQYAHERDVVHLDLKPANVLVAADGQPMLLDFHLARGPIFPDDEAPPWLGGTDGYMSPEQQSALRAVAQGRKVPLPVDGRSDVYSLGVVLYEALAGCRPAPDGAVLPLHRCNPRVGVGLSDVIRKCLAADARDRYPRAGDLAADLRRHLADLPLAGVRNRSPAERWRKWRRRRPHGVALAGMALAVLAAAVAVAAAGAGHFLQRIEQARASLDDGRAQAERGEWEGAVRTLRRGRSAARDVPFQGNLADDLGRRLALAERARSAADRSAAARELHRLADRVRLLCGTDDLPHDRLAGLEASCLALWANRDRLAALLAPAGEAATATTVREDLRDVAMFLADLRVRLAPPGGEAEARRAALAVLEEAEASFGPSRALDEERRLHGAPGRAGRAWQPRPGGAWEECALARSLLRSGQPAEAAARAERAARLQPGGLWPNYYRGLCAFRSGRFRVAARAYAACVGAALDSAAPTGGGAPASGHQHGPRRPPTLRTECGEKTAPAPAPQPR
jgi:serine/threonine protein kinase